VQDAVRDTGVHRTGGAHRQQVPDALLTPPLELAMAGHCFGALAGAASVFAVCLTLRLLPMTLTKSVYKPKT